MPIGCHSMFASFFSIHSSRQLMYQQFSSKINCQVCVRLCVRFVCTNNAWNARLSYLLIIKMLMMSRKRNEIFPFSKSWIVLGKLSTFGVLACSRSVINKTQKINTCMIKKSKQSVKKAEKENENWIWIQKLIKAFHVGHWLWGPIASIWSNSIPPRGETIPANTPSWKTNLF